ncbi:MAG: phosphate acyltransferase PlsX [Lachnospiraceae bacterium]|nr:phosphate acyltransferase PlsX [Lachnospiraceae bacterium]
MEYTKIAVDAMGGDNAPFETVKGAVLAVKDNDKIKIFLTGPKDTVEKELAQYEYDSERISVIDAPEIITNDESPVNAIRQKKNSSLVVGLRTIKSEECDAFVSAGSTGAILAGASTIAGKLPKVMRTPLAPLVPTKAGYMLLTDCGANVDAKPQHLLQFAKMGSIYMENVVGVKNPRVGLLNIGVEEEKGNALVKEALPLFKECRDINFIGFVEAREALIGGVDVVVCEAFAGNIMLKTYEGAGSVLLSSIKETLMSSLQGKIGGLIIKGPLGTLVKKFKADEYGGAPLLGLKGLVVKTHGNATHREIYNSILQCVTFKEQRINEKISEVIAAGSGE